MQDRRQDLLWAPDEYWDLSEEEHHRITNGVGPKGLGWLFPDTIYLLTIKPAADVHDYMYEAGKDLADKAKADRVFMNNMVRLIGEGAGWLRRLRTRRAHVYYLAVTRYGGAAFWVETE